jgi:hypothetical protein
MAPDATYYRIQMRFKEEGNRFFRVRQLCYGFHDALKAAAELPHSKECLLY